MKPNADQICCEDAVAALALLSARVAGGASTSAGAGLPSVLLRTPLSAESDIPLAAALAKAVPQLTVVIDHFRHCELLSRAAESAGRMISVLIVVETGRQLMGVCPGPDCASLSRALVQQPGLRLRGLFADTERVESAAGVAGLSAARAAELAWHCLRTLRQRGLLAEEVVLGLGADDELPAESLTDTCTVVRVSDCGWTGAIPGVASGEEASAVGVRVISRPALEYCVIGAGSRSGLVTSETRVLAPAGAIVEAWNGHHSRLQLAGAATDLRIGDVVTLGNFRKHT
jgi:D-serine deaminase-like pyridoxal phosphate-dependent protein